MNEASSMCTLLFTPCSSCFFSFPCHVNLNMVSSPLDRFLKLYLSLLQNAHLSGEYQWHLIFVNFSHQHVSSPKLHVYIGPLNVS